MKKYVVITDPEKTRNVEILDERGLDEGEKKDAEEGNDDLGWVLNENASVYIGIYYAESEEDAVKQAADRHDLDPESLYGIEVE